MEEIKYRVWDKNLSLLAEVYAINFTAQYVIYHGVDYQNKPILRYIYFTDCILMQFTGLKDKNDKEIYEDDILKTKGIIKGEVVFRTGCFRIDYFDIQNFDSYSDYLWFFKHKFKIEVVGNKHENPKLLEKT